ncbi:MAG TPA: AsmA family protein [Longimicrobiales bacterium]|nr:AsmA family protein [Longimicrobiales bacterium]
MDPETHAPTPSGPSPHRRRLLKATLAGATVLVVLFVGVSFLMSRFLDPERLASWLEPQVEAAVNRDVSVGGVKVGIFPLGVRLEAVSVSDPTGLAPRLAYLERLDLRVRFLPLLKREVRVREIRLQGLEANLRVGADGLTNFGDFSAEEPDETGGAEAEGEEGRPFALQLDGIRLSGGSVSYVDTSDSLTLQVTELDAEASVRHEVGGPWTFDGIYGGRLSLSGSLPSEQELPALDAVPLELRMALEADEDFGAVQIREGTLAVDQIRMAVSGEASDLKEPVRTLRLALQGSGIPLADVVALLPDSVRTARDLDAQGTLSADLTVEGPLGPDATPTVLGTVEIADGGLRMGSMPLLEAVQASARLDADRSLHPRVRGRLLGGNLELSGVARLQDSVPSVDVQLAMDPDLSLVDGGLLPEGMTARGRLPSSVRVVGNPRDAATLGFWGEVGMVGVRVTHPGLGVPAGVARGSLALEGNRATLAPTAVTLGDDDVELQGTLRDITAGLDGGIPEFRGAARGSRISLVELSADPPADTTLTYGRVAFAKVGGRQVHGVSADDAARDMGLSRPTHLPLAGEIQVALDTVLDRKGRMEDVEATLVFGPDFLQVTRSSFRRYGGRIQAEGALEVGGDPEEPFSLKLVVEGVDAGAFLGETTPLGRAITGSLDLNLDLAGALDGLLLPSRTTLQGAGSFSLTGGGVDAGPLGQRLAEFLGLEQLANLRVRDWSTGFVLRDGLILLDEATMEGAPGSPSVGGGVGLDGALDLVTAFDLPREDVEAAVMERLGIPQGAGGMAVLAAVLRVGGTLWDPQLRADPSATVQAVTEAVQDQARAEVDRQIQERQTELQERATGFLRGLLGRRDTAQAPPPPPDTVRADTLRADTLPGDTARPDTLRPDTLRPDTVRPDTMVPDTARPDTTRAGNPGAGGPDRGR